MLKAARRDPHTCSTKLVVVELNHGARNADVRAGARCPRPLAAQSGTTYGR